MFDKYEATNELVTASFACDSERVREVLRFSRTVSRTRALVGRAGGRTSTALGGRGLPDFTTCVRANSRPSSMTGFNTRQPVDIALGLSVYFSEFLT